MRVFFLVVLLLAGCATPVKHAPPGASAKPNAEPIRKESTARPGNTQSRVPEAMPQQLEQMQPDEPELSITGKGWIDISGNGRDISALFQDSAACQISYKQALATAWQLYPEPLPGEDGTRNAQAVTVRQQNVRSYADASYTACMESRGWRKN